jgi:hypothetical protein
MDNPYQPPSADGIGAGLDKPGFFTAFRQASQKPAIAWGFWERGRILHGIVLSLVVVLMVGFVRPESAVFFRERIGNFFVMVIVANVLYSTAYVFEVIALIHPSRRVHPTLRYVLLIGGTFLAVFFTILVLQYQLLAIDD